MRKNRKTAVIVSIIVIILVLIYLFVPKNIGTLKRSEKQEVNVVENTEPMFKKEGELQFFKPDKTPIKKIAIEVADNDQDRMQGLMYRKSMADSVGMLFKFELSQPQGFWMKNTHISLDIIYVNENMQVVSIQKYTVPFSEKTLPSYKNAQYVVEVNAGFCDKYGIGEGSIISFTE